MGIHTYPAKMLEEIPTYYVTDTAEEDAGGGNVRIVNYERVRGVLVPRFRCIVASMKLLTTSRKLTNLAEEIFKSEQLRLPGMKVH